MRTPAPTPLLWLRGILLVPVFVGVARAGLPPAARVQGNLTEADGVRVLHVWGEPRERGFARIIMFRGVCLSPAIATIG